VSILDPSERTPITMKLLLTSAGIKNASIHDALLQLLGKPIAVPPQDTVIRPAIVPRTRGDSSAAESLDAP